jgi:hypothetical protein
MITVREEEEEDGEHYKIRIFIMCTLPQML